MNKTLLVLVPIIVIVAGLIGYTLFGKTDPEAHTAGDGHTEAEHSQAVGHTEGDGHTETDHAEQTQTAPHDDTGTEPHID